jgi:hypothetical protein
VWMSGTISGGTNPTLRLKYGTTTLASTTITSSGAGAYTAALDCMLLSNASTTAQVATMSVFIPTATINGGVVGTGTATENSATTLNFKVTCQNASSGGSTTAVSGYAEYWHG